MLKTWPSWRTWRRIGIGVFATLIVIVLGLRLFAMSPMARNMVETRLEAMQVRGQSIEIDGLRGDLLGRISIQALRVRDGEGVWLTASDLDLRWHPSGLVSRHLKITTASAETLDIFRRPALAPSRASSGSVADRYTLKGLQLEQFNLSEGVAGPAQSYAMTGALQATSRQGSVQLDLSTLAPNGDMVRADLAWGGAVPLAGDINLTAVPNGLVATLLGAPDNAPLTFDLTSSVVRNHWQLTASGSVDGTPALDVEIELSDARNSARGEIALNQLRLLAPLQARFGERLIFDGHVEAGNQLRATARTDSFDAALSGVLQSSLNELVIEDLDLTVSAIEAGTLTSLQDLSLPQLSARGTLNLRRDRRAFEGRIEAPNLTYGSYQAQTAQSEGRLEHVDGLVSFNGQLSAAKVNGLPSALQDLFATALTLHLDANYGVASRDLQARSFHLQSRSLDAMGAGSLLVGGAIELDADITLENIYSLAESRFKLALSGPKLAELTLRADGSAALATSVGAIRNLVGDQADFSLIARRTPSGLAIQSGRIENERILANASGAVSGNAVELSGRAAMSSLSLSPVSAANIDSAFEVSGPLSRPQLTTTATADTLTLAGQTFERPDLTANVTLAETTAFNLAAQSDYSGEKLSLIVQGHRRGAQIDLTQLLATWADLQATGQAALDTSAPSDATLSFEVAGISPIGGTVDGTLSYAEAQLSTDLSLVDLTLGALDIDESKLKLSGTWPRFEGHLDYRAEFPLLGTPQDVLGRHPVRLDASTQSLTLSGASELAGNSLLITNPVSLSLTPNLRLAGTMSAFGGDVSMIFDASGATPAVFALSGLKMSEIGPLLERPSLVGTLDGAFTLGLEGGKLTGGGSASIINLARGIVESNETNLTLQVEVEANQLAAELRTDQADMGLDLMASLEAPLTHQDTLSSVRIAPGAAIPVAIKGNGAFGPIWALIAPTNLRLAGDVDLDISNGPGTSWRFEGPFSLKNAAFEDGYTGIHLKDITATAHLRPDGIDVDNVSARGASGGRVTGRGLYGFDGNGSVTMTLNGLNAFKRSDVSGSLSGTAEIERRNRRTQISGDLEIDQARINLERLPDAGYTTLDVDFQENGEREAPTTPTREAIELRLDVSADRRIFVSGSGVDTEWGLDARVTGPPGRPNVIGRATLIRGEADLLSRRFRFSDGAIRFVGAPIDSQISLRADRTSDDITSSISLSGTLMDPEITLSSSPSLPDDEILSRVLFGRSPSELSPLQAAQLAGAAAQLAGGDAFNLVGQLQAATGLDRLDIGLDEAGGALLSTGKYLADDIYLEIESGVTGAPGVTLEWTPLENVAVDAEIDPELGPKLAIQWKRDFDRLPGEPKDD